MLATKDMIKRELWISFGQIENMSRRAGSDINLVKTAIGDIEKELGYIKQLAKEYEVALNDWRTEFDKLSNTK